MHVIDELEHHLTGHYKSWKVYIFFSRKRLLYCPVCCKSPPVGAAVYVCMQVIVKLQHRLSDYHESWQECMHCFMEKKIMLSP